MASLASGSADQIQMTFLSIVFEGAPFLLLGSVLSGFIYSFLPSTQVKRLLPKNPFIASLVAGLLGLVFPLFGGTMVPIVRRMVKKGLPISSAVTYLLSAPLVNIVVFFSTWTAFLQPGIKGDTTHWVMAVGRLSLGYAVAVLAGWAVSLLRPESVLVPAAHPDPVDAPDAPARGFDSKLVLAMRTAMRDFLETAMYFTFGVIIISLFKTQANPAQLASVTGNDHVAAPVLMLLSYVLAQCSSSDAFLAPPLKGFSYAAKLAFLVFGPMLDIKLTFVYATLFRPKILAVLSVGLFVVIALLSGPWIGFMQKVFAHAP